MNFARLCLIYLANISCKKIEQIRKLSQEESIFQDSCFFAVLEKFLQFSVLLARFSQALGFNTQFGHLNNRVNERVGLEANGKIPPVWENLKFCPFKLNLEIIQFQHSNPRLSKVAVVAAVFYVKPFVAVL